MIGHLGCRDYTDSFTAKAQRMRTLEAERYLVPSRAIATLTRGAALRFIVGLCLRLSALTLRAEHLRA